MRIRFVASLLFGLAFVTAPGWAQTHPLRDVEPSTGAAEPDQPVRPQVPVLVPRAPQQPAQPPVAKPPFTLTEQEQAQVDHVLALWEQRNRAIKTFDCSFTRWIYDMVFNAPRPNEQPQPKFVDTGVIRFAAPDRGVFRVEKTQKNGAMVPIEDARSEHWICDGRSIFELNPTKKQLIEHQLPPEMQGKAIANSPLPFLFGAEAKKLKERYYIRIVTPVDVKDQVWLEAYPRQPQAAFHHAQFIIAAHGMAPFALKLVQPNQKDYIAYQFQDIVLNDPLRLFKGDPFRPYTPIGWTKVVEPAPSAQASRVPNDGQR
jgi:TIGR03009 family protein